VRLFYGKGALLKRGGCPARKGGAGERMVHHKGSAVSAILKGWSQRKAAYNPGDIVQRGSRVFLPSSPGRGERKKKKKKRSVHDRAT